MSRFLSILRGDLRSVRRDSMLLVVSFAPLLILALLRFVVPQLDSYLQRQFDTEIDRFFPVIYMLFATVIPLLFGMVSGFLLLDEMDQRILSFVAVTPTGRAGYLVQKILAPTVLVFGFSLLLGGINGIAAVRWPEFIAVAFLLALETPLVALFIVAFGENKVAGVALAKVAGLLVFGPIVAYFGDAPLALAAGVLPTYWIGRLFFLDGVSAGPGASGATWWLLFLAALCIYGAYGTLLARRFGRRI